MYYESGGVCGQRPRGDIIRWPQPLLANMPLPRILLHNTNIDDTGIIRED